MKVYILEAKIEYEPGEVVGVFFFKDAAERRKAEIEAVPSYTSGISWDHLVISEWEVQ